MTKLSILETRPKKWKIGANIIMCAEGTNNSHVAVSWKDEEKGIRYVAEARGGGIRIVTNTAFKKDNHIVSVYSKDIPDKNILKVEQYIWNVIAHDYSIKQLVGLAEMRIINGVYRLVGSDYRRSNRFRDGDYSQICVELGINVIEIALNAKIPGLVENYGLREGTILFNKFLDREPQSKVDRINGIPHV